MSPDAECPSCHKIRAFHDDEMEGLEEGLVICAECGLEVIETAFTLEVLRGEHDHLAPKQDDD